MNIKIAIVLLTTLTQYLHASDTSIIDIKQEDVSELAWVTRGLCVQIRCKQKINQMTDTDYKAWYSS